MLAGWKETKLPSLVLGALGMLHTIFYGALRQDPMEGDALACAISLTFEVYGRSGNHKDSELGQLLLDAIGALKRKK